MALASALEPTTKRFGVSGVHCPDEHLELAELRQAALVITKVALELLV